MAANDDSKVAPKNKPKKFDGVRFKLDLVLAQNNIATEVERSAIRALRQLSIDQPGLGTDLIEPLLKFVQVMGERAAQIALKHTFANGDLMHHVAIAARSRRQFNNRQSVPNKPKPLSKVEKRMLELVNQFMSAKAILRVIENEKLAKVSPDGKIHLKGRNKPLAGGTFPSFITHLKRKTPRNAP